MFELYKLTNFDKSVSIYNELENSNYSNISNQKFFKYHIKVKNAIECALRIKEETRFDEIYLQSAILSKIIIYYLGFISKKICKLTSLKLTL